MPELKNYWVRYRENGKGWVVRCKSWDRLCTRIEDLESRGIDASNWGNA